MQIVTDDNTIKFHLLDLDFVEIVLLTDALAFYVENRQAPCADTLENLTRAIELACKNQRDKDGESP